MSNDKTRSEYFAPQSEMISFSTEALLAASDLVVSVTFDGNATLDDFEAFDLFE